MDKEAITKCMRATVNSAHPTIPFLDYENEMTAAMALMESCYDSIQQRRNVPLDDVDCPPPCLALVKALYAREIAILTKTIAFAMEVKGRTRKLNES